METRVDSACQCDACRNFVFIRNCVYVYLCVYMCVWERGEENGRGEMGEEEKVGWKKRKVEGSCVTERRLCTVANKWPAITCNLPHIYIYIYIGAVASLSTIARPFLVFVAVFEVLDPHPRGPYIDRRVIVSAQRPERRCSKG